MGSKDGQREIDAVRGFNRFYTRQIGVLDEGLLDSPFTLAQARVLFKLAQARSSTAGDIGERLGLDAGYLSRILQGFAKRKLITRRRSQKDSRRVELALTPQGRKVQRDLDRRSHVSVGQMLSGLRGSDRQRLLASLSAVHQTLEPQAAPASGTVVLRDHQPGDIGWAIARHGEIYAQEFGWEPGFEGPVA